MEFFLPASVKEAAEVGVAPNRRTFLSFKPAESFFWRAGTMCSSFACQAVSDDLELGESRRLGRKSLRVPDPGRRALHEGCRWPSPLFRSNDNGNFGWATCARYLR